MCHHFYLSNDSQIQRETFFLNKNKDEYPISNTIFLYYDVSPTTNKLFICSNAHRIKTFHKQNTYKSNTMCLAREEVKRNNIWFNIYCWYFGTFDFIKPWNIMRTINVFAYAGYVDYKAWKYGTKLFFHTYIDIMQFV